MAWIGDDAFFGGLRKYFDKHAWGNATLADLLGALSESSGRDIDAWAQVWLRTPQVNTLRPEISWDERRHVRLGERAADRSGRVSGAAPAPHRHQLAFALRRVGVAPRPR